MHCDIPKLTQNEYFRFNIFFINPGFDFIHNLRASLVQKVLEAFLYTILCENAPKNSNAKLNSG